ncbi:hypothetical protein A4X09_0g7316 [Tilletia walkeri]|uniref:Uncharacterized protein n=1 Tax=Tilletia walkeri TaxID=117179 RepID=A0A8X7T1G0_9BASI|nr:hypothetical protein A4X09_0g7316 [Tilletia walkeri]
MHRFFSARFMIRAIQKWFQATPETDHEGVLDYKEVAKGKQNFKVAVKGNNDAQIEREAGVARPKKE